MAEIQKILVPIDFSEYARFALDEAIGFAKVFSAELHLLHCYPFLPGSLELYGVEMPQPFESDMREAARERMAKWRETVRAAGVKGEDHMGGNPPALASVDLAGRIGADWIVLGTRGLSRLKHVLLGSVAERVVRLAPCPVLTVSFHAQTAARVEIGKKKIDNILVPVDFSDHAQRALDEAIGLARTFGAELHLLHCYQLQPGTMSPYGLVIPASYDHDVRIAALRRLAEWRGRASARKVSVREHITANFPADEIPELAEKLGADLIVMGTRGATGFKHVLLGSVAERTIRTARCPVLTVKSAAH